MSSQLSPTTPTTAAPTSPNNSTTFTPSEQRSSTTKIEDPKSSKRRFFGLGKKKEAPLQQNSTLAEMPSSSPTTQPPGSSQPISVSPLRAPRQSPGIIASSPSRLMSSSPRLHSPASSEIFERNVQEQVPISALNGELSPAHIPAHVMTEDHIPPALEASAQAITSEELNPDDVEIVMSASHQPAAAAVLEGSVTNQSEQLQSPLSHQKSEESVLASFNGTQHQPLALAEEDTASNYGQLDPNDVRRLSFISFKDIVQSEHQHQALADAGSREGSIPGATGIPLPDRATSPLRSPRSPTSIHSQSLAAAGITTPPLPGVQIDTPANHLEQSPVRSVGLGSPASQHGELTIETMRQALRKTASGDLGGVRGLGGGGGSMSPIARD